MDMEDIEKVLIIAKKYNLKIIIDAAQVMDQNIIK